VNREGYREVRVGPEQNFVNAAICTLSRRVSRLRKFIFFTNEVSGFWYGDDHPPGADDFLIVGADLPRMEERQRWVTS
jgi:hypothetical protein